MKQYLIITLTLCLSACSTTGTRVLAQQELLLIQSYALNGPESVYPYNGFLYVSNMAGAGNAKDGQGWISKLNKDGSIVAAKWVDGLHAPKGLRVSGGVLFTADIDAVVAINLNTGKIIKTISLPDAKLLNDVEADGAGGVYVSDTGGARIYRVSKNFKVSVLKENLEEAPNGLILEGKTLYVANYFSNVVADSATYNQKAFGRLMAINLNDGSIRYLSSPLGNLDGLERSANGQWLITGKRQNLLLQLNEQDGSVENILSGDAALDVADIGYEKNNSTLYIPSTAGNWIRVIKTP